MPSKHPPEVGKERRSPARGFGRRTGARGGRGSRPERNRPKRIIVIVILVLIVGLLIKRAGTPTRTAPVFSHLAGSSN
jgi:hypothetical protein